MKKNFMVLSLIAAIIIANCSVTNVQAKTITLTTSKPDNCSFSSAWERTRLVYIKSTDCFIGELCYGYDTVWINEDYVWTRSIMYKHKSYLLKSGTTYTSDEYVASSGTTWAIIEKAHTKGVEPIYGIQFTNATEDTNNDDFTLGEAEVTHNKE